MRPQSLSEGILFTDFYQLTMAQLYFASGLGDARARFDYFYRKNPDYGGHRAGFCIFAGLPWLIDWMHSVRFDDGALTRLRDHRGPTGKRLFADAFLDWLAEHGSFDSIEIDAIPEGRVVHPAEPLAVVRGPLILAQLLESAFLNHCNYQTLIATKAHRVKQAARGALTIEFGMRRAQSRAANAGARAAMIGGADFSSNTGISFELGFAPKGTHAHSMVQAFMALGKGELGAFRAYADAYPDACILLVDTIDTLNSGVPNAITVFKELRERGHTPAGIRLDSGDLAHLAVESAAMLNDAEFEEVPIVLSNKLDEVTIAGILDQIRREAPGRGLDPVAVQKRLVYGVGTRLITSRGRAALDGVYKLVAVRSPDETHWRPALKISETPEKTLNPGDKRLWRIYGQSGRALFDVISRADEDLREMNELVLHDQIEPAAVQAVSMDDIEEIELLHEKQNTQSRSPDAHSAITRARTRRDEDLARAAPELRELFNPGDYRIFLTRNLWNLKRDLAHSAQRDARQSRSAQS